MYYSKQSGRNQCNIYNNNMKVFLKDARKEIDKELLMDSVITLAEDVDTKDNYIGKHSKMVFKYSILLAEKLSEDEFDIIKNHTFLGFNIIKHITNDEEIIDSVRSHHERWDGKGYPNRLSGNSINLFARIVCIADVYHAMTSDRSYRKALTKEKAIEEFIKGKDTQFDSKLVEAFIKIIEESMENKDIHISA
jgi:HD-GYP domain-containing protein (c-di-GMP phosphodiesterase class II)